MSRQVKQRQAAHDGESPPSAAGTPTSRSTSNGNSNREGAQARRAVAEYLHDLGIRDPDVVARESRRITESAREGIPASRQSDEALLTVMAIRLTVRQLERWLTVLTSQTESPGDPERLGGTIALRVTSLLEKFPESLTQDRLPPRLLDSLRRGVRPVVPASRPRRMRRQAMGLVPPVLQRLMSGTHRLLFGGKRQT